MAGFGVDRNETADGSGAAVTPVQLTLFTAKGDIVAATANATVDNLPVGANETRLVADSTQATGLKYVADTTNYAVAAKGDLLVGTAADTVAPLTVGANNTILVADSAQASGVKWEALAASTTVPGLVELATTAEVQTGTDTTRAVTPDALQNGKLVLGTAQATTSGTSIDFTSIPSWVKRITLMLDQVSTNGTSVYLVQLGDSGGIEVTGYVSGAWQGGSTDVVGTSTAGFAVVASSAVATSTYTGRVVLSKMDGNKWVSAGSISRSDGAGQLSNGVKTLSATLDRIRLTTVNGTDTFDAGAANISYE